MYSRMPTSLPQKSSEIPADFRKLVQEALVESFSEKLNGRELVVHGTFFPEEILFSIGLKEKGSLRQTNFESSIEFKLGENPMEKLHNCSDFLQGILLEFFESNEALELPLNWKECTFKNQPIYFQSTGVNTELESEADKFLRDHGFQADGTDDFDVDPFVMARERARDMGLDTGSIEREGQSVGQATVESTKDTFH